MAKLITDGMRKAIKKMAEISQCARALSLMPTAEDFAMRLIGDLKIITRKINEVSIRINGILERYSNIPVEFLLDGFDEVLEKLNNVNDYTKFAIQETADVMNSSVKSAKELTECLNNATTSIVSASLQIGGGLAYGTVAMGANIKLAWEGNGRRRMTNDVVKDVINGEVAISDMEDEFDKRIDEGSGGLDDKANNIKNKIEKSISDSTEAIDNSFLGKAGGKIDNAIEWIGDKKESADKIVDNTVGALIEKVENAKREVEEKIQKVKDTFDKLTKDFDDAFGFINGKHFAEETFRNMSNTAYEMDTPVYDALGEVTGEVADFIKNFNIGKVVTAFGGLVVGAGAATLVMDLLPRIDVDRMLKDIIGGVDTYRVDKMTELQYNKYFESEPDLLEVPDVPWRLSKDDLEKYNAEAYNKYLEDFADINDTARSEILGEMQKAKNLSDLRAVKREHGEENKELLKKNKSALNAMRKVRRDAIKAKQIEKYKGFLSTELNGLKKDFQFVKVSIKNEWDSMMTQYKTAISEIKKFFTVEGCGGSETVDRCCDRINDDATQIVELCKSITLELTSTVAMVPTPYAIGTCVDMPVHKILAFIKDIKIIITFLKNLIRLGIDIISQLTILVKLIFNGLQSLADLLQTLKDLIGVDKILNMIDYLVSLFRPKMIDAKMLLENGISPIYYNETEDYEQRVDAIEALLEGDISGKVKVEKFKYSDDPNARKKYKKEFGGKTKDEDEIEDWLEELEAKGEREIYAYRSPLLNDEGDDFAGWIYYHANAYDNMKDSWSAGKKRRRNKVIKKASKKNKLVQGKLVGGVAQLKKNKSFGYYNNGKYKNNTVTGFDAYYWYTEYTNDPTNCTPDESNIEYIYDENGNYIGTKAKNETVVSPIMTTENGSMVEVQNGNTTMRVFVEGRIVKSGDFINVNGVKYRVK